MPLISLSPLPYEKTALNGFLSEQTLTFHHDKHLATYVETTNKLRVGTAFEHESIYNIIVNAREGALYNNAAQVFNHEFYFNCLSATTQEIPEELSECLKTNFGTVEVFLEKFVASAVGNFGSGWTWLVKNGDGLEIVNTQNAGNPLLYGKIPLLTVDVWEHAYYLDYQNRRADYVKAFCNHVNWAHVLACLHEAK
ncbi:MAG: superoxide dismutase [Succinivibrio sp.]|nr:superoxide dismutase [Succinivibrio sp.]